MWKLSSNNHSWNLIYLSVSNIYKNIDSSTSHDTILFPKEICEIVNNSDYGKDFRDNQKKLNLLVKPLMFISCYKVISCIIEEKEKENNKSK